MTGLVLISKESHCHGLIEKLRGLGDGGGPVDCICGSGAAAPLALLYAAGVSPDEAGRILSETAACGSFKAVRGLFEAGISGAAGRKTGFCVPVMDMGSHGQYSFTNLPALVSGRVEEGMQNDISPSIVAASAAMGVCPGFEYGGRIYSAGRENPGFCVNCLKRLNYRFLTLEG